MSTNCKTCFDLVLCPRCDESKRAERLEIVAWTLWNAWVHGEVDSEGMNIMGEILNETTNGDLLDMPDMKLFLDMDGKFQEVFPDGDPSTVKHGEIKAMGTMEGGMSGGLPAVGLMIKLDDGTIVYAETSLKLLQMAHAAFHARFGDVTGSGFAVEVPPQ